MMNYWLPLDGIMPMHCSANLGDDGSTALFFGLSGTGKTTLSADPKRKLIGDDEHGWDDDGIFNFEGGCYAKTINLTEETEPDIYRAIKRDAMLENVAIDDKNAPDYFDVSKTQNGRVSYPLFHIDNHQPDSMGGHPDNVIFLTCDAFGVLPPVSRLSSGQAMYHFLSGYTAKVAGTERGVTEPEATFSACFGAAFLTLHPTKYADLLQQKLEKHGSNAYLVNTGWTGGAYGTYPPMDSKIQTLDCTNSNTTTTQVRVSVCRSRPQELVSMLFLTVPSPTPISWRILSLDLRFPRHSRVYPTRFFNPDRVGVTRTRTTKLLPSLLRCSRTIT